MIGTTQEVKGVDWVVAGVPQDMEEVWSDAETGLRNSPLLQISDYSGMKINKITGPSKEYKVAMPMLFLDELFSATTNMLVGWSGVYTQLGEGGNDSNLAKATNIAGSGSGTPWFLLSTLKAPMVENITNARSATLTCVMPLLPFSPPSVEMLLRKELTPVAIMQRLCHVAPLSLKP